MTQRAKKIMTMVLILIATTLVIVAGCQTPIDSNGDSGTDEFATSFNPKQELSAQSFKSVDEYKSFLKQYSSGGGYYGGMGGGIGLMRELAVSDNAVGAPVATKSDGDESLQGADYSQTNNQVESVDEADIIKTDGNYIYTITGKTLFIVKAYPAEDAEVTAEINLEDYPRGIFILGDKLAVFGDVTNSDIFKDLGFRSRKPMTFFNVYDIADRENPDLIKEYRFEGSFFEARLFGDYAYFISTTWPEFGSEPMPLIMEDNVRVAMPVDSIYYYPHPYDSAQLLMINSISMSNPDDEQSVAIAVEGSQTMYMSEKNMYVAYTKYINEWELRSDITKEIVLPKLPEEDQDLIEKIEGADTDVLSKYEKESKIMQIISSYVNYLPTDEQESLNERIEAELEDKLDEYEYMEYTVINKVEVSNGDIELGASGEIPGHLVNQFSLDEHENVLRVATTVSQRWDYFGKQQSESQNQIYTLDSGMDVMDSVKDIAEGEQIFSTRFIGERLYMVTFRQVDPFFAVDLSDPENIEILGELKIPGFSRYLHPYDEDTIIGIGRDATERGEQKGIKISLFDVSDVSNPREIAKYVSKDRWSQTTAEWEHKAFLFSKEKNLLVIPAYNYDYQDESDSYNGALVFNITKNSIELRGLIDHSKARADTESGTTAKIGIIAPDYYWYSPQVERSLFIEDMLYTKSPTLIRINALDDLHAVKDVALDSDYAGEIPIY